MPPKKQIQLQDTLETQDEWEPYIAREGLAVVDVYSGWCGPCKAVQGLFRRVKNELGDDLLRFATAKSDTIDALEAYRERSEPTFLMYSANVLVSVVRGALGPQLERTIREQLEHEHSVLDGKAERKPVIDEGLNQPDVVLPEDVEVEEPEEETRPEPTPKQFTVLVIKPDAVQAGKVDDIVEKVEEQGYQVLAKEERQLTKEDAAEFYKQHEGSEHFEALVDFMSSGPCMTLILTKGDTGEGVIDDIRNLIGPPDVEQAKQESPESLRAVYGTDTRMNAVHASDSKETASRELAFFLPKFKIPYVPGTEPPIERTLALIRPHALAEHRESILQKIQEAGFEVAFEKELVLSKEQAEEFYKEHEDKEYYDSLTNHMSSGPMLALCLAREDAISEWRKALGPKTVEEAVQNDPESLRAQFAVEGSEINALHGSSSVEDATKEIQQFFPVEKTMAVIKPNAMSEKEMILSKVKEAGFTVSLSNETHLTKEMAEQLYGEHREKEYFDDLTNMMTSGPSMFMVLTREDAVTGWRALMGPADPEAAKDQNPSALRALFGQSILENAVHGSSNAEHAAKEIETIFGNVEFNPDGSVKGSEAEAEGGGGGGEEQQQPLQQGGEAGGEAETGAEQETVPTPAETGETAEAAETSES